MQLVLLVFEWQRLLDVASIPLPTPISLRQVINNLAAGKVPKSVSNFLAGGCLIALVGCPPDIRPIAVGETIRRLAGNCMCALVKGKAAEFFQPRQLGVAVVQGQRRWPMLSVDALRSTGWTRTLLCLSSESGVQQGDPLGHLLFALVLQKLVSSLDAESPGSSYPVAHVCLASNALRSFDEEVMQCFAMCSAINVTDKAWSQHSMDQNLLAWAVLISSTYSRQWQCSTPRSPSPIPSRSIPPIPQKVLSGMIQAQHFHILLGLPPLPNRARLLSVAAPHASSWLLVVPSPGLGLHLESNEYQMAIRWWLGLDTFGRSMCSFCPDTALDPLGHHAVTCRHGGDSESVERGHGLTRDLAQTRPTDILIAGWDRGKPVALDLTITSPLCYAILSESCHQAGAAALAAEAPVETYGNWGNEAHATFSRLASYLAIHQSSSKSAVAAEIYGQLNMDPGSFHYQRHPGHGAPTLLTAISGKVNLERQDKRWYEIHDSLK
ncbi:hypothetical protein EMCRGX_G032650 [Ephydatia muelleri]